MPADLPGMTRPRRTRFRPGNFQKANLRVCTINSGGLSGQRYYVQHTAREHGIDVVVCTECKMRDNTCLAVWLERSKSEFKWHGQLRDTPPRHAPNGGLGFLYNRNLAYRSYFSSPKGIMVSSFRKEHFDPVVIIALYVPPVGSVNYEWTAELLHLAEFWRNELKDQQVLIVGDLNMQLAGGEGRHIEKTSIPVPSTTPQLRDFCTRTGMQPVAGRRDSGGLRAFATSRPVNEPDTITGHESDYILAAATATVSNKLNNLDAGVVEHDIAVIKMPQLPDMHKHFTHCWSGAMLRLHRRGPPRVNNAPDPPRLRKPTYVPQWKSDTWHKISDDIAERLTVLTFDANAAPNDMYGPLVSAFLEAMITHAPSVQGSRWEYTVGHFQPKRLMDGAAVPPRIQAAIRKRKAVTRAIRGKRAALHHAKGNRYETLLEQIEVLTGQYAEEDKKCKDLTAEAKRQIQEDVQSIIKNTSQNDLHVLFDRVLRVLAPDSHLSNGEESVYPDEPGHQPAGPRFFEAYKQLYSAVPSTTPAAELPGNKFIDSLPTVDGSCLVEPFTADEVFPKIFPPDKAVGECKCKDGCENCLAWIAELLEWDNIDVMEPAPVHNPRLRTSTCSGSDHCPPEAISWPRPAAQADIHAYRMLVCTKIAALANAILRHEKVPNGFLECVTSPLRKYAKPGQPAPNFANPDNTRGITCSNTLAKVFGLLLLHRLSHWAETNHLISPEQVAFQARRSSEMHVWTLQQILLDRYHRKEPTSTLFADFKKAYDKVHRPILWLILRKLGVPEPLVKILEHWHDQSFTRLNVNGQMSDPISMKTGVLQGAVLSPLLFNFFVEPLIRYIKANDSIPGVRVGNEGDPTSIVIKILMFADDAATPCNNNDDVKHVFAVIDEWATDCAMEIGLGNGKTEIMACVPGKPLEFVGEKITVNGKDIHFTKSYRYLGLQLQSDLSIEGVIEKMKNKMQHNLYRLLLHNPILRRIPNSTMIMLIKNIIIGSVLYLSFLVPLSESLLAPLEQILRETLREMERVSNPSHPSTAIRAYTGQFTVYEIIEKGHLRFHHTIRHPSNQDLLAAQTFNALVTMPNSDTMHWNAAINKIRAALTKIDVQTPDDVAIQEMPRKVAMMQSTILVRQAAVHKFYEDTRVGVVAPRTHCFNKPRDGSSSMNVSDNVARPLPSSQHIRQALHKSLGNLKCAPIGQIGPGCQGSLPLLSRLPSRYTAMLNYLITGRGALRKQPFLLKTVPIRMRYIGSNQAVDLEFERDGMSDKQARKSLKQLAYSKLNNPEAEVICPMCTCADNAYHIMVECQHPAIVAVRQECMQELQMSLNREWGRVLSDDRIAYLLGKYATPVLPEQVYISDAWDWNNGIGKFVFWRHIMGLLWTDANVPFLDKAWLLPPPDSRQTRVVAAGPYNPAEMPDLDGISDTQFGTFKMLTYLYSNLRTPSFLVRNFATGITRWACGAVKRMAEKRAEIAKHEWKIELQRRRLADQNDESDRTSNTSLSSSASRSSILSGVTSCTPTSDDTDSDDDGENGPPHGETTDENVGVPHASPLRQDTARQDRGVRPRRREPP